MLTLTNEEHRFVKRQNREALMIKLYDHYCWKIALGFVDKTTISRCAKIGANLHFHQTPQTYVYECN